LKLRFITLLSTAALFILSATPATASTQKFDPPKSFYLALGDSLAFGFQQAKFLANLPTENPSVFNTGYVDDFSTMLQTFKPAIRTVNFGCPGETSVSFIVGPCVYAQHFQLHNSYGTASNQLDAALDFLKLHRGQVSPITIDLGANDVDGCNLDLTCIQAGIANVATNMRTILTDVRDAAPSAEIIVMEYYNPLAVIAPASNAFAQSLNSVIAADAAEVRGRLADAFTPFNLAAVEPGTLCALTLFCTPLHDIHASDAGYLVIAQQFLAASGYGRLGD
jgi:lysophospholipase L1-like esterase